MVCCVACSCAQGVVAEEAEEQEKEEQFLVAEEETEEKFLVQEEGQEEAGQDATSLHSWTLDTFCSLHCAHCSLPVCSRIQVHPAAPSTAHQQRPRCSRCKHGVVPFLSPSISDADLILPVTVSDCLEISRKMD